MRLAFFDFNINYGGGPQGTVYLAERLSEDNEVHIIDAYGACDLYCDAIKQANINLYILQPDAKKVYIGNKGKPVPRFKSLVKQIPDLWQLRNALAKKVREINPDVIWVNNEKSLVFLATSLRLRKYSLVMYVRYWARPDQVSIYLRWLLKHRVRVIIAHARATIKQLKQQGISEKKLYFTQNTINMEKIQECAQQILEDPLHGIDKWPKILLPAARPVHEKGHLTAVRALAQLKRDGYDPALWLPGKVATGVDNSFLEQLQSKAEQLNVKDNIYFLGWCKNMSALINACDIVILPTHTEGFPRVILEAMLLKRPVCATPVGGIPEAIEDGKTGLLFDVDDSEALTERIDKLVSDSATREMIVKKAYDFVRNNFRPDDNTRAVLKAFALAAGHCQ